MSDVTLTEALALARRGWLVIPLHHPRGAHGCSCGAASCGSAGKHPATLHGLKDASRDVTALERWFRQGELNVGVVTGSGSGLVVLDVDAGHDGEASLEALEARHGAIPATPEVLTGAGRHLYFAHPGGVLGNSAGKLGPGLDVRGDGGYVVAPPSLHRSGRRYAWEHSSPTVLAPLPGWLLGLLRAPAAPRVVRSTHWLEVLRDGVGEGGRNAALASLAGHLFRQERLHPLVVVELALCWNEARCRPPLPQAEVLRTLDSIASLEATRRAGGHRD
jgi:putative DNA primase/helicase